MKVIIDTNSLISLVRYYLPFDSNKIFYDFIKTQLANAEMMITDKVFEECKYVSKGIVFNSLDFLKDKEFLKTSKLPTKTDLILEPNTRQFYHQLSNVFVNQVVKSNLTEAEFKNQKDDFLNNADMKQILLCKSLQTNGHEVLLVTDETENANDNKLWLFAVLCG